VCVAVAPLVAVVAVVAGVEAVVGAFVGDAVGDGQTPGVTALVAVAAVVALVAAAAVVAAFVGVWVAELEEPPQAASTSMTATVMPAKSRVVRFVLMVFIASFLTACCFWHVNRGLPWQVSGASNAEQPGAGGQAALPARPACRRSSGDAVRSCQERVLSQGTSLGFLLFRSLRNTGKRQKRPHIPPCRGASFDVDQPGVPTTCVSATMPSGSPE
jgi:hypothetical protein